MTREEAIDLLDNLIGMVDDNHDSDYDTVLKMAIDSLKQEPCDDCVSRADALHSICRNCEWYQGFKPTCINKCDSYKRIMKLPSVQPKQWSHPIAYDGIKVEPAMKPTVNGDWEMR